MIVVDYVAFDGCCYDYDPTSLKYASVRDESRDFGCESLPCRSNESHSASSSSSLLFRQ